MDKPKIEFVAKISGLSEIKEILPFSSKTFIPEWWKNTPYDISDQVDKFRPNSRSVRQCPAFPDLFSSGFILPMWADTTIYFNKETQSWSWRCGSKDSPFNISYIDNELFIKHSKYSYNGKSSTAIFQFEIPWQIKVSKGYSVFQMPLFYFNNDFSILPGTFDSITNQDKLEVVYFGNDVEIFIKKGTPLVQYIPYKKTNYDLVIREMTETDRFNSNIDFLQRATMFKNWYAQNRRKNNE